MSNPITALGNIKRWQAKLKPAHPYVDMAPFTVPIFQAMFEGRPFSWVPSPAPSQPLTNKQKKKREALLRCRLDELDTIAARLELADPGGAARAQADRERRLRSTLAALDREQAAGGKKPHINIS
jgi:hypothetical protein